MTIELDITRAHESLYCRDCQHVTHVGWDIGYAFYHPCEKCGKQLPVHNVTSAEIELYRHVISECVGLIDLMRMGMTVDQGNALLAECERKGE